MSPKELLYIEDALGHEKQLKDCFSNFAMQLSDTELKNLVQGLCTKSQTNFDRFYALLGQ